MFVGDQILMVRIPIYNVSETNMKALHDAQPIEEQTGDWNYLSFKYFEWLEDLLENEAHLFTDDFVMLIKAVLADESDPKLGEIEFLITEDDEGEDDDSL